MKISKNIGIYDVENPYIKEDIITNLGNSQITEPEILIPIYNVSNSPNANNYSNTGNSYPSPIEIEVSTPSGSGSSTTPSGSGSSTTPSGTTSGTNTSGTTSNNTSEPSATTDDTKTYVGGGTTPDSTIVIKKSNRKYYVYVGVALIVGLIAYKVLYNKNKA